MFSDDPMGLRSQPFLHLRTATALAASQMLAITRFMPSYFVAPLCSRMVVVSVKTATSGNVYRT
jgi:hypothetical protein